MERAKRFVFALGALGFALASILPVTAKPRASQEDILMALRGSTAYRAGDNVPISLTVQNNNPIGVIGVDCDVHLTGPWLIDGTAQGGDINCQPPMPPGGGTCDATLHVALAPSQTAELKIDARTTGTTGVFTEAVVANCTADGQSLPSQQLLLFAYLKQLFLPLIVKPGYPPTQP